jgi:transposase
MKQKPYKQKFREDVGYEADSGEHSVPTPTVDFDFASIDAADENSVAADSASHGPTRDEMDADLKRRGLSKDERTVLLASVYDRKSTRQIAAEIGKSHVWVAATLKRVRNLSATSATGLSQAVQERREAGRKNLMREKTLSDAMNHAHNVLSRWPHGCEVDAGHISSALEELGISATANETQGRVAMIAVKPEILLQPKGQPFVETLVELLTAARYGKKREAASARKILTLLIRATPGNRCPVPDRVLAIQSYAICVALHDLQRAWREFTGEPIRARLDGIREMIGSGHDKFTNRELQSLMTAGLPTASARVAEKVTGIASESFIRAWKKHHATRWIFPKPARQ